MLDSMECWKWVVVSLLLFCLFDLFWIVVFCFFYVFFHLFKNCSTLLFFFLKCLFLVREDMLEPLGVWIIDGYELECCGNISTILSLVIEAIEDPMEVWMIDGNNLKRGNLSTIRRLRDCWSLNLIQVPTWDIFWFHSDFL